MSGEESKAQDASSGSEGSPAAARRKSSKRRKSSVLQRARMSFVRSRGQRGADVETLRGNSGSDFEAEAKVSRGAGGGGFCGCLGGGDGEPKKERFVLVKGAACFIFSNEDMPAPKYAIMLAHMRTEVEDRNVMLETSLGDVEYKFMFHSASEAEKFASVVAEQAAIAEAEIVKERLGHGHLLKKRASIKYAQNIAENKEKDAPEQPITAAEVMAAVPVMTNI